MSSTGIISDVIAPTTSHRENQRKISSGMSSIPGLNEGVRSVSGTIRQIHEEKPRLVKAYGDDGAPIADDNWIELNHSAQEIAEKWGTVRMGFRVRVSFIGPAGASANATIIGVEQEDVKEPHIPNEVSRGMYALFAPGIGVG